MEFVQSKLNLIIRTTVIEKELKALKELIVILVKQLGEATKVISELKKGMTSTSVMEHNFTELTLLFLVKFSLSCSVQQIVPGHMTCSIYCI